LISVEAAFTSDRKEIRCESGTIPAKLSDFEMDPPSLLAVPVKNEMPVKVEMTWPPQAGAG